MGWGEKNSPGPGDAEAPFSTRVTSSQNTDNPEPGDIHFVPHIQTNEAWPGMVVFKKGGCQKDVRDSLLNAGIGIQPCEPSAHAEDWRVPSRVCA